MEDAAYGNLQGPGGQARAARSGTSWGIRSPVTADRQWTAEDLPVEIDKLRNLLLDVARERRIKVYDTVLPFGFEVLAEPENWDYHCTPVNAVTFGATGGDGIHLSLLTTGPAAGAVVMTAPPSDTPNTILGSSFGEFLRLGYYACFAWLEILAFDPRAGDTEYRRPPRSGR